MGEDIHQKTYIKSKKTGKYISIYEIANSMEVSDQLFKDLIPYRYYDLYSLFGSRRSDFQELPASGYGFPDFIKTDFQTEYALHHIPGINWYGHVWFTYTDLKHAITNYIERLKDPLKYFPEDSDMYLDAKEGKFEQYYPFWKDQSLNLINACKEILEKLDKMQAEYNSFVDLYSGLFNLEDTIFLFWFDN